MLEIKQIVYYFTPLMFEIKLILRGWNEQVKVVLQNKQNQSLKSEIEVYSNLSTPHFSLPRP